MALLSAGFRDTRRARPDPAASGADRRTGWRPTAAERARIRSKMRIPSRPKGFRAVFRASRRACAPLPPAIRSNSGQSFSS